MNWKNAFSSVGMLWLLFFTTFGWTANTDHGYHGFDLEHPQHSQYLTSNSPQVWLAISSENPVYSSSQQEYSGGHFIDLEIHKIGIQTSIGSNFGHPSFYSLDQRTLIFQYLYPFHFFF